MTRVKKKLSCSSGATVLQYSLMTALVAFALISVTNILSLSVSFAVMSGAPTVAQARADGTLKLDTYLKPNPGLRVLIDGGTIGTIGFGDDGGGAGIGGGGDGGDNGEGEGEGDGHKGQEMP